jgi:hypothetical protein
MIQYGPACPPKPDAQAIATATIEHMARTMLDMQFSGIPVDEDKLALYGDFTSGEIREHWAAARDRAVLIRREGRRAA